MHSPATHTETATSTRLRAPAASALETAPRAPRQVQGYAATVTADGRYDVGAIMILAHRRAAHELALLRELIATGKLPTDTKASHRNEMKAALRHVWSIARSLQQAHPANASAIQMVSVTPFGRQVEGVRRSAF